MHFGDSFCHLEVNCEKAGVLETRKRTEKQLKLGSFAVLSMGVGRRDQNLVI